MEILIKVLSPVLSMLVAVLCVRLGLFLALKFSFVAHPNPIVANHERPVALGGGIGLVIGLLCGSSSLWAQGHLLTVMLGVLLVFLVGLVDDLLTLKPLTKFALQGAAVAVYLGLTPLPGWSLPWAGLFLLATQNAWNLVDVMDGLAGRISVGAFIGIAGIGLLAGGSGLEVVWLASCAVGAASGFLVWNEHPARTYLGDAGSLSLGMLYGQCVLELAQLHLGLAVPLLLVGLIPLFELLFLIVVRTRKGIPFYRGSPDHFALRLLHNGHSVKAIVQRVLFVGLALDMVAWGVVFFDASWSFVLGCALSGCSLIMAWRFFAGLPARRLA